MKIKKLILSVFIVIVFCVPNIIAQNLPATPLQNDNSSNLSNQNGAKRKILFIADNQEHMLTGRALKSMSPFNEKWVTSVALRSPLANIGGKLLMAEAVQFGRKQ